MGAYDAVGQTIAERLPAEHIVLGVVLLFAGGVIYVFYRLLNKSLDKNEKYHDLISELMKNPKDAKILAMLEVLVQLVNRRDK